MTKDSPTVTDTSTARRAGTPPLRPLAERPGLVAGCAIGGLALGLLAAVVTPTTYTAETRLAVGTGELSNLNIPGYPTASADIASNYARWVTAEGAGGRIVGGDDVTLSASPIPESNVIRIEADSGDPDTALAAADEAAEALTIEVNKVREEDDPENVLADVAAHAPELAEAEQKQIVLGNQYRDALQRAAEGELSEADTEPLRAEHAKAYAQWQTLDTAQDARVARYTRLITQNTSEADLSTIQPAEITGDDRASNLQRFGLVGLVLGAVLGFLLSHLVHRRRGATGRAGATGRQAKTAAPGTATAPATAGGVEPRTEGPDELRRR